MYRLQNGYNELKWPELRPDWGKQSAGRGAEGISQGTGS